MAVINVTIVCSSAVSHKKRVLLRWQGSEVILKPSPVLASSRLGSLQCQQDSLDSPAPVPATVGVAAGGCGSPLFEEFSDSDEFPEHPGLVSPRPNAESALASEAPEQASSPGEWVGEQVGGRVGVSAQVGHDNLLVYLPPNSVPWPW